MPDRRRPTAARHRALRMRAGCPLSPFPKSLIDNELPDQAFGVAAPGQRCPGLAGHSMASIVANLEARSHSEGVSLPLAVARVVEAWPRLATHIREAIQTLVDAGLAGTPFGRGEENRSLRP